MLQRTYNTWRERKFVQNAVTAVEPEGTMGDENDTKMNMDVETMSTPAAISLRR
jgi:hypothetical protein